MVGQVAVEKPFALLLKILICVDSVLEETFQIDKMTRAKWVNTRACTYK